MQPLAARFEELRDSAEHARLAAALTRREAEQSLQTLRWNSRRLRRTLGRSAALCESSLEKPSLVWAPPELGHLVVLELLHGDDL
jgi:hypothetical protein